MISTGALAKSMATALLRHLLTLVAGALVARGVLTDGMSAQFIDIGLAIGLATLSLAWSWFQKQRARKNMKAAINAPAPTTS